MSSMSETRIVLSLSAVFFTAVARTGCISAVPLWVAGHSFIPPSDRRRLRLFVNGSQKISIQRIEGERERQVTYGKRKMGMINKARSSPSSRTLRSA